MYKRWNKEEDGILMAAYNEAPDYSRKAQRRLKEHGYDRSIVSIYTRIDYLRETDRLIITNNKHIKLE